MREFVALAQKILGPSTVVEACTGVVVTSKESVHLASELVRATEDLRKVLPPGAMLVTKYHTREEDRYSHVLVQGVSFLVALPHR